MFYSPNGSYALAEAGLDWLANKGGADFVLRFHSKAFDCSTFRTRRRAKYHRWEAADLESRLPSHK